MHALLLVLTLATATGGQPAPKHIDVDEDEVVEGETARGDGEALIQRKQAMFGTLIKLRADFRPELLRSADSL
jgi:hypothetical protein